MNFADKKIAEFDNEFWLSLIKYNTNLAKNIRNFVYKTISEAEGEAIARYKHDVDVYRKVTNREIDQIK